MLRSYCIVFFVMAMSVKSPAQAVLEKANACYDKADYQCATDNYLISLEQKSYKEDQRHILEARIGMGYFKLGNFGKSAEYYQKAVVSKPDLISNYWGLGDAFYESGDYKSAINAYKNGSDKTADAKVKEEFDWWIGQSYIGLKDRKNTIAQFQKVSIADTNYIKADVYIADAFYGLRSFDSAIYYYKKYQANLSKNNPSLKNVKSFIGKCYRELYKYDDAMKMQDSALAIDADYLSARWEKGIIYANKKDYAAAIEQYKRALPAAKDSVDIYTLCGNLSACNQNLGNWQETVNWLAKRKSYASNKYADYAKIAATQFGKLNQPGEAEKTCQEAINLYAIEPVNLKNRSTLDYARINAIAGLMALQKKDTVKAQQYFDQALKIEKTNYEANAGAGKIAWARKNEGAFKTHYTNIYKSAYDTVIASKKDIAEVYGRSAYVDAYFNNITPSTYKYSVENALKFDSLQKEAVLLWPRVLLSETSYSLERKRAACIAVLNKSIIAYKADKEYVSNAYNCKAVILEKNDTAGIKLALESAVKICPENIEPWNNLLKYYGSYDNARGAVMTDQLIAILKKKNDAATTAVAYVYKGDFLWRLDKKDDARKAWQEALVWDSGNSTAKDRIKM